MTFFIFSIFDSNLGFSIRSQPRNASINSRFCYFLGQFLGVEVSQRHHFLSFISCISYHKSLISSSRILYLLVIIMKTSKYLITLLIHCYNHRSHLIIHTLLTCIVTNLFNSLSSQLFIIQRSLTVHLPKYHTNIILHTTLTSHLRILILLQTSI